jgi:Ca2+-binding RTX toxin-like protein
MTTWTGTAGDDVFNGNSDGDIADGGAGNDTLLGKAGDDYLIGGIGDDFIFGNSGADTMLGGDGNDTFQFTPTSGGPDSVDGGAGSDTIAAGFADTTISLSYVANVETITALGHSGVSISGTNGADALNFAQTSLIGIEQVAGGFGDDWISGSQSGDTLNGQAGNDTLLGRDGNDVFLYAGSSNGFDSVDGGAGTDTLRALTDYTDIGLSYVRRVDVIDGGAFTSVRVVGGSAADYLDFTNTVATGLSMIYGDAGNDTIIGTSSADTIDGGLGQNSILAGGGDDVIGFDYGGTANWVDGGLGNDTLQSSNGNNYTTFSHISGIEHIAISAYRHEINGTSGNDTLDLGSATTISDLTINGGGGSDIVVGSAGNDYITTTNADSVTGGTGADVFSVNSSSARGATRSIVTDFQQGVDLIDAYASTNYRWTYIGHSQFNSYTYVIRIDYPDSDTTVVQLHFDNNQSDIELALTGHYELTANDFIL